ncbi:MAG: ABC transporter ATP-binding protein [Monoglobales bacterium]
MRQGPMMGGRPGGHGIPHEKVKLKNAKGTLARLIGYMNAYKLYILVTLFLSLAVSVISILTTRLNGVAIDKYISTFNIPSLGKLCIVILTMHLISALSTYFIHSNMIKVSQNTSANLRRDLFDALQKLPLKYFDNTSSGDIMSRLTNDVDNINITLSQSVAQLLSGVINITGTLIAMIILSPPLTFVSLVTVPLMLIITRSIMRFTAKYFRRQQKELGELNGYVEEMVSGQKAVILFRQEENVKTHFGLINKRLRNSGQIAQTLSGVMGPVMNLINNITYLIVAVVGGYMILTGSGITPGIIFSFLLYTKNFSRPINEIANLFNTMQSALAGAERVFEVMDESREEDAENAEVLSSPKGSISIKNVTFSYIPGKPVLKNASFDAVPGQTVAIVGPTGAGKTTIISLLSRFYDIDSGTITIDGKNIYDLTRDSLRGSIGMVLQDTYLFSESVLDNIKYGRPTATDEEVIEAAKKAGAHSFISQLENGYETVLSDNGQDLSQGQRQLLAIARAMLARPPVLILDEATSSIDTRTELKIQEALKTLMEGRTNFVIAHRLSTIRNADVILVIDDGEIVEKGNHDELIEKDGFYANLYNSQFRTGLAI